MGRFAICDKHGVQSSEFSIIKNFSRHEKTNKHFKTAKTKQTRYESNARKTEGKIQNDQRTRFYDGADWLQRAERREKAVRRPQEKDQLLETQTQSKTQKKTGKENSMKGKRKAQKAQSRAAVMRWPMEYIEGRKFTKAEAIAEFEKFVDVVRKAKNIFEKKFHLYFDGKQFKIVSETCRAEHGTGARVKTLEV